MKGTIAALVLSLFIAGSVSADEEGAEGAKGNKGKRAGKAPEARWEKRFDKIDTNDDGQISKAEFLAFKTTHQHHHKKRDK